MRKDRYSNARTRAIPERIATNTQTHGRREPTGLGTPAHTSDRATTATQEGGAQQQRRTSDAKQQWRTGDAKQQRAQAGAHNSDAGGRTRTGGQQRAAKRLLWSGLAPKRGAPTIVLHF